MSRNKIYIITIVVCVLATVGVLYWSSQDSSSGLPDNLGPTNTNLDALERQNRPGTAAAGSIPQPDKKTEYPAPRVFPNNSEIDLNVFNSSKYQALNDYEPLTVSPEEIGRDNPYQSY